MKKKLAVLLKNFSVLSRQFRYKSVKPTKEEKLQMANEKLDHQIATKREMKKIFSKILNLPLENFLSELTSV